MINGSIGKLMAANRNGHLLACMWPIELPLYAIFDRNFLSPLDLEKEQRSLGVLVKFRVISFIRSGVRVPVQQSKFEVQTYTTYAASPI